MRLGRFRLHNDYIAGFSKHTGLGLQWKLRRKDLILNSPGRAEWAFGLHDNDWYVTLHLKLAGDWIRVDFELDQVRVTWAWPYKLQDDECQKELFIENFNKVFLCD